MKTEFYQMRDTLKQAKLCSFLLIPLKYEGAFNADWLKANGTPAPFTTMDLNESVKRTINSLSATNMISRYLLSRDKVLALLAAGEADCFYACEKGTKDFSARQQFTIHDMEIYVFHTQVAFLCVKIQFSRMKLLDTICNFGYVDDNVNYYVCAGQGEPQPLDLQGRLLEICSSAGLAPFFSRESSLFLEAYTYTTAVVEKRFETLETMQQATFNLHLMVEPESDAEDAAEEDINYVYAVKDQSLGSYRWGCCVTSQTINYIVADSEMDIDGEMHEQSENGLPVVLLALYQKYTCLRFKELISVTDNKAARLKQLKKQLLEFQAYGTITPANISRWHNIRQTYRHILETNDIPQAIDDISITLNLLAERQKEIETAKSDAIMGLITIFSIVSIPTSIIGLMDVIMGGNSLNIITAVISLVSIALIIVVLLLYKERS